MPLTIHAQLDERRIERRRSLPLQHHRQGRQVDLILLKLLDVLREAERLEELAHRRVGRDGRGM